MKAEHHKSTPRPQARRRHVAPAALLLAGLFAGLASAGAQPYSIDWHKVSGGGAVSANGQFAITGTIGQHDAGGAMIGGSYSVTGGFWAIYAVQTPGAPTLYIVKSGANAIVYWSSASTGYLLESNSNLKLPGGWATVTPGPAPMGGYNYVTNQIVPGNVFYRLRHP